MVISQEQVDNQKKQEILEWSFQLWNEMQGSMAEQSEVAYLEDPGEGTSNPGYMGPGSLLNAEIWNEGDEEKEQIQIEETGDVSDHPNPEMLEPEATPVGSVDPDSGQISVEVEDFVQLPTRVKKRDSKIKKMPSVALFEKKRTKKKKQEATAEVEYQNGFGIEETRAECNGQISMEVHAVDLESHDTGVNDVITGEGYYYDNQGDGTYQDGYYPDCTYQDEENQNQTTWGETWQNATYQTQGEVALDDSADFEKRTNDGKATAPLAQKLRHAFKTFKKKSTTKKSQPSRAGVSTGFDQDVSDILAYAQINKKNLQSTESEFFETFDEEPDGEPRETTPGEVASTSSGTQHPKVQNISGRIFLDSPGERVDDNAISGDYVEEISPGNTEVPVEVLNASEMSDEFVSRVNSNGNGLSAPIPNIENEAEQQDSVSMDTSLPAVKPKPRLLSHEHAVTVHVM